jgi:hypothetical protein
VQNKEKGVIVWCIPQTRDKRTSPLLRHFLRKLTICKTLEHRHINPSQCKTLEHPHLNPSQPEGLKKIKRKAANLVLDADQTIEDNGAMTSLHVIQTIERRVQSNATYQRQPRQRPCRPRSLGQPNIPHIIQVHFHTLAPSVREWVSRQTSLFQASDSPHAIWSIACNTDRATQSQRQTRGATDEQTQRH